MTLTMDAPTLLAGYSAGAPDGLAALFSPNACAAKAARFRSAAGAALWKAPRAPKCSHSTLGTRTGLIS